MRDDLKSFKPSRVTACNDFYKSQALHWVREGRYSDALQALTSTGIADHDDDGAYQELLKHHPTSPCPDSNDFPSALSVTIDKSMVLTCLKGFPKGTSPGASKLRDQHLLDAVSGPAAKECLRFLTCFMNFLLSGKGPTCLALWLCGNQTALLKKGGGVRPIAVGEVLHCLASRLCCLVVRLSLPDVFLPYGQSPCFFHPCVG